MEKNLPTKQSEWIRLVLSVLVFLALILITVWAAPKVMSLRDEQTREALRQQMQSHGLLGWLAFLGIQILQVVVAMIRWHDVWTGVGNAQLYAGNFDRLDAGLPAGAPLGDAAGVGLSGPEAASELSPASGPAPIRAAGFPAVLHSGFVDLGGKPA